MKYDGVYLLHNNYADDAWYIDVDSFTISSYIFTSYTYTCPKVDTDVVVCASTTVQCNYLDINRAVKCHIKGLSHRTCRGRSRVCERIDRLCQINSDLVTV